ncbi:substrate-binding periplasmic protein [Aquipseudomonas guryensis]|uniref:Transporter substrate-binding domain-containing protein n=1 Tax=Aquipseudomonas guryensis TaxID=2759165 RepID=A0A7W4DDE7_9GAMM|nr:transporter substrate-binding domain-containing protein [Pseudomonas guryensis]MBB1520491.1 transporter substrate-binding domain-containing protein [Pseudomonas guryensis]
MRGYWLGFVLLFFGLSTVQAEESELTEIRLVSEHWTGHTNPDGSGLAWDILRQVFEPAGVRMNFQIVPYTRSIGLVQRGEADAWLGSYRDEVTERIFYPRWHYDSDQISALGLASQPLPTLQTLGSYRLAWMRGYDYQNYLPGLGKFQEVERRSGILHMLERGHADFYIDALTEVEDVIRTAAQPERFRITELTRLPLYPGFADTARGKALAQIYDRRMAELVQSDALRPLFQHWQQPYPFDKDMEKPDASP